MVSEMSVELTQNIILYIPAFVHFQLLGWSTRVHEIDVMVTEFLVDFIHHAIHGES